MEILLALAAGVIGAFVGHRKWMAETRLAHYTSFLEAAQAYLQTVADAPSWPMNDADVRDYGVALVRAGQWVRVSGRKPTAAVALRLVLFAQPKKRVQYDDQRDYRMAFDALVTLYLTNARADIQWGVLAFLVPRRSKGLPPPPD